MAKTFLMRERSGLRHARRSPGDATDSRSLSISRARMATGDVDSDFGQNSMPLRFSHPRTGKPEVHGDHTGIQDLEFDDPAHTSKYRPRDLTSPSSQPSPKSTAGRLMCPAIDPVEKPHSPMTAILLLLSLYSTIFSALFLLIAITKRKWGQQVNWDEPCDRRAGQRLACKNHRVVVCDCLHRGARAIAEWPSAQTDWIHTHRN